MASAVLRNIQEEVTCPICLELLQEPVSTDCGHTFCQACITSNYESSKDQDGKGNCPVCQVSYQFENLKPNRHVANIVEELKAIKLSPEDEQMVYHCERHGEKLQLFCKKDKKVICLICERSQEHLGHKTLLIEEAAPEYQKKLQAALQKLMKDKKECEAWKNDLREQKTFWQNQIQRDRKNVQEEFQSLRDILDSQEKNELQKLKQEEEEILSSLSESENEQVQTSKLVGNLISEVERRLQAPDTTMLQNVDCILNRSETLIPKKLKIVDKGQRRVFRAQDLKRMLQGLGELAEARCYWVQVTLVENNHPNIVITEDKRQIKYEAQTRSSAQQGESCHEGVLGHPAIQSGKHYWEVDVSGKRAWILGLSDGSYFFNPIFQRRPLSIFGVKQNFNYQPKYGFWVIGMRRRLILFTYNAFEECPLTCQPRVLTLSLTDHPSRVGVFLDYEAHTLSFYDVSNHGVLIHRFSVNSFPDKVFPYFNPMRCSEPMSICWLDS